MRDEPCYCHRVEAGPDRQTDRELRALHQAGEQHPSARKRLLTLTGDGAPAETAPNVTVQPAYEWMLTEPEGL
jgi:hypothetical protein